MVRFDAALRSWLGGLASFAGRSTRAEYWYAVLLLLFGYFVSLALFSGAVFDWLVPGLFLVLQVSLFVRRAHDVGLPTFLALPVFVFVSAMFFLPLSLVDRLGPWSSSVVIVALGAAAGVTLLPSSQNPRFGPVRAGSIPLTSDVVALGDVEVGVPIDLPPGESIPAGWYADPLVPNVQRYFDGVAWTASTAPEDYDRAKAAWLETRARLSRMMRMGVALVWVGVLSALAAVPHSCGSVPGVRGISCTPVVGSTFFGVLLAVAAACLISGMVLLVVALRSSSSQASAPVSSMATYATSRRFASTVALFAAALVCVLVPAVLVLMAISTALSGV